MQEQQLHQLAQRAVNQRQFNEAQQALIRILNNNPNFYDAYFLLGVIEAELGSFTKAAALIEKAATLKPLPEYFAHLAKCFAMMGNSNKTYDAIESAKGFEIKDALTFDTIGVALSRLGDHEQAIEYFEQAIARKETSAFYYNLGASQTFAGQFEQARYSYEKAIELQPLFYQAHSSLSHLGGISETKNHVDRLMSVYGKMPHPDAKLHISHALAKELEALGRYREAFEYLEAAKRDKRVKLNYQFEQDKTLFEGMKSLFSEQEIGVEKHDSPCAQPIFVVGMPRSGTTLVERVLTNNEVVKSIGERQEFGLALKQLTKTPGRYILDNATIEAARRIDYSVLGRLYLDSLKTVVEPNQRFVDKMPLNVFYGGLIASALPKAKIICVIRNPMDTVWGNFKQLFSLNDPYYNYAYDQTSIAKFYAEFIALAEYWQSRFPNQFKIVSYDEFVTSPQAIGKEMVEFCGLHYDEAMLDITQNRSAVATASSVQVRTAINTKSLGQWRRFETWLRPAMETFDALGIELERKH